MLHALEYLEGGDSLLDFVPRVTPTFSRPHHLGPVADLIARALRGEAVRACVHAPPRHAKTETAVIHGVPWYLSHRPDHHVAYVTYEANLARAKSARARDITNGIGLPLKLDSKSKSHWLTPRGGGFFATGVGGPLTGYGFQLALVDDPFKNRVAAESPTIRETVHQWFTSTLMTRIEPEGSVIVMHTRWHADDLIGRLLKDTEVPWEHVSLPAMGAAGAALWPERWSAERLDKRRREVGPYDWASLYMGEPRPRGARLFGEPKRYTLADLAKVLAHARILVMCDPAATEKTTADYSAIAVLAAVGYGLEQRTYVLEVVRMQCEIPRLITELVRLQAKWKAMIGVEAVGGFKAVPQMLRTMHPKLAIYDVQPFGDKFTRALPVAAAWTDGRLMLPESAPWMADFLAELGSFTGVKDAHDDQVDALSNGFNTISRLAPPLERGSQKMPGLPFG